MGTYIKKQGTVKSEDKERAYNWATIVYEESVKPDYESIITISGVAVAISPNHDKDVKEDGSLKKPHRHILMHFKTLKSRKQILEYVSTFGGVGAEKIISMEGQCMYLTHKNSPEKVQYDESQIILLNGFDMNAFLPAPDEVQLFQDISDIVERFDMTHFSKLIDYVASAIESGDTFFSKHHFSYIQRNSYFWVNYLKSRAHEKLIMQQNRHMSEKKLYYQGWKKVPDDFEF